LRRVMAGLGGTWSAVWIAVTVAGLVVQTRPGRADRFTWSHGGEVIRPRNSGQTVSGLN
jgi:hypothetical protein